MQFLESEMSELLQILGPIADVLQSNIWEQKLHKRPEIAVMLERS